MSPYRLELNRQVSPDKGTTVLLFYLTKMTFAAVYRSWILFTVYGTSVVNTSTYLKLKDLMFESDLLDNKNQ